MPSQKFTHSEITTFLPEDTHSTVERIDFEPSAHAHETSSKKFAETGRFVFLLGAASLLIIPWIIILLRLGQYVNLSQFPPVLLAGIACLSMSISIFVFQSSPKIGRILGLALAIFAVLLTSLILIAALLAL